MSSPTGSQPLWLEQWNAQEAFNESQRQIRAEGNARGNALAVETAQRQLDFNATNGLKNPVYLETKARDLGISLGNAPKNTPNPYPTNPVAPTSALTTTSPITAKPTSSMTTSAIGIVAGAAGSVISEKAGRAVGGDLGAGYGEALGAGLAAATTTAIATGNPAAAAVVGGLTTSAALANSALDALDKAISAGKGLEKAKANLAKSEERYQKALEERRRNPFTPLTRGENAGKKNVTVATAAVFVTFVTIATGERSAPLQVGVFPLPISTEPLDPIPSEPNSSGIAVTHRDGVAYANLNRNFYNNWQLDRIEPVDVIDNGAPPYVNGAASPIPLPQPTNSLPWLPNVDLRGSNADRLAFPEPPPKLNVTPIPSSTPKTSPNIPPSRDPTGKKKPEDDDEKRRKPYPTPNAVPINSASPSSTVGTGSTTGVFNIPSVDPATALILGSILVAGNTTQNLLNQVNQQTSADSLKDAAKAGSCEMMQSPSCTKGMEDRIKDPIMGNVDAVKDQTVANAGAISAIANLLATIWEFLQNRIGKVLQILNNTVIDRTLGVMNLVTNIHNAALLTRDIGETLGSVVDNVIGLTGLRFTNSEGSQVGFTDVIGSNFRGFLIQVLGAERYVELTLNWQKASMILNSAAQVLNTTQSMLDPISSAVEYGMENVSKGFNALREDGVVSENAYPAMDETIRARRVNRFERLNDTLEGAENIASNLSSVTSSAVSIKEDYKQLREDTKDLKDKATAFNTADSEARAALKAELPTEITPITLAPAPAEDEAP
ncbi:hypothetical protein [Pseudanabaena sp. BC1403]|uniref:hypothetical protein n=1 Tax=Pseudanabaena sp. BC1403 TaxID=2043171 RepID=UPI000CD9F904|nr:hypothetical protein [Pseudanabaena sp. BC1403]